LDRLSATDEAWCMSEILRIKGELLLLDGTDGSEQQAETPAGLTW
jgi:hypothetical protein